MQEELVQEELVQEELAQELKDFKDGHGRKDVFARASALPGFGRCAR